MNPRSIFILVPVLGLLLASCKEEQAAPPAVVAPSGMDLPVLKIEPGDYWSYRVRIEIPAGVTGDQAAAVDSTHQRTRTFLGKTPFIPGSPDVDCFEVIAPNSPPMREFVNIFEDRVELRGDWAMKNAESRPIVLPTPVVFFKAGLQAGDTLPMPTGVGVPGSEAVRQRVCAVIGREECVVPAGSFPSVRMLMNGLDGKIETRRTIWFSPGTGIVKEERIRYAEGKVIVKETHELAEKGHKALTERPKAPGPE
ncbi:hypothetical protein KBB96_04070 [Luteolibacter ambystomatis]|uniref:Lipoprotein n=1 Tax=Luteolibacter ambystomatis TaxID=2824561 RepID=A0A975J125_9BACT|nr:hypothetical protein [Luteolibacter ambystomatis]QUE52070.1 hypothetical protein KBB96_04070 [Luteolibacter ambystomatis]